MLVGGCNEAPKTTSQASEPSVQPSAPPSAPPSALPRALPRAQQRVNFGVTIAGAEFGSDGLSFCNEEPGALGVNYFHNNPWTFNWFHEEGVDLFRVPFRWERIQPLLGGPLEKVEIDRLVRIAEWAEEKGVRVIFDMHNFGRYSIRYQDKIVSAVINKKYDSQVLVSSDNLIDVWSKIIRACDAVEVTPWALGLMNEPHDMGLGNWRKISRSLVTGIRAMGSHHTLLVAGDGWSSAENWKKHHGAKTWIEDPLDKVIYEAHVYFDHDGAGRYGLSFSEELRRDPKIYDRPQQRLAPFLKWLKKNNARGIIGEIGVPNSIKPWESIVLEAMVLLQQHDVEMVYWAAGEWWGDYQMSIQPPIENSLGNDLFRILKKN